VALLRETDARNEAGLGDRKMAAEPRNMALESQLESCSPMLILVSSAIFGGVRVAALQGFIGRCGHRFNDRHGF
jgi:hypothetical protein